MTELIIPIILLFLFICSLKIDIRRMKKQIKELEGCLKNDYVNLV